MGQSIQPQERNFRQIQSATKKQAVQKYKEYLKSNPLLLSRLHELKGKRLGCWCKPGLCHGDAMKTYDLTLP